MDAKRRTTDLLNDKMIDLIEVTAADAGKVVSVKSDGRGFEVTPLPVIPPIPSSTETVEGIIKISSTAMVIAGIDNSSAMPPSSFRGGALVSSSVVNTTSGTSHDITGIPSWAKRITILLDEVSSNGTSDIIIQLGVGGTPETTNYNGTGWTSGGVTSQYTSGFIIDGSVAAAALHSGSLTLLLLDASTNTWAGLGQLGRSDTVGGWETAGSKALAGVLNMVRLTTVGGANTFDNGKFSAIWE